MTRNVHQRKLAVMRRLSGLSPDKVHPHHRFRYVSIQALMDSLRAACVEEGLDVVMEIVTMVPEGATEPESEVVIRLVNVDAPEDQIRSHWPVVPDDKGFAYSVKYPLLRLFLVGDGEEADEAVMAEASGRAVRTRGRPAKTPPPEVVPTSAATANGGAQPTADDLEALYELAEALPTPRPRSQVQELLRRYPYPAVWARVARSHAQECGVGCEHMVRPADATPAKSEGDTVPL